MYQTEVSVMFPSGEKLCTTRLVHDLYRKSEKFGWLAAVQIVAISEKVRGSSV